MTVFTLWSSTFYIISSRKTSQSQSQHRSFTFISAPVHQPPLALSTPPSFLICQSAPFFLCPLLGACGTRASGRKPSLSHRGRTVRHATTIRAMDLYCFLSQDWKTSSLYAQQTLTILQCQSKTCNSTHRLLCTVFPGCHSLSLCPNSSLFKDVFCFSSP